MGVNSAYRHIGTVTLRSDHDVYEGEGDYLVETRVRKDPSRSYGQVVSAAAVDAVSELLQGFDADIHTLADAVGSLNPGSLGFRYHYGFQLYYEVERALLAAVASGRAGVRPSGSRFTFYLRA
jgi:hypothetical protein